MARTRAVLARPIGELQRLAQSDREVYATHYQLLGSGIRLPEGSKWDPLRGAIDNAMFSGYHDKIRFAALSLDGIGLSNYGECSITFRDSMIAHRTTVFEENNVLFVQRRNTLMAEGHNLPKGYLAIWAERHRLCVAKLHERINTDTQPSEYARILLQQGATSGDDEFVEVYIFGEVTVRTIESVTITRRRRRPSHSILKSMVERLRKLGVTVTVRDGRA
jgi:hypothetical protein